jgi:hypothetical protein
MPQKIFEKRAQTFLENSIQSGQPYSGLANKTGIMAAILY